jgi:RNA recognition motif-containing protein
VIKKLFVSNISFSASEEELREYFAPLGEIQSLKIITDKETGRSRGFGFIEMDNAYNAMDQLHGTDFKGRKLTVLQARER